MKFFIGLNRLKRYQILGLFCWIPMCLSLNMLSYLNSEEVISASLIGEYNKNYFSFLFFSFKKYLIRYLVNFQV